jgi:hypothetical protein
MNDVSSQALAELTAAPRHFDSPTVNLVFACEDDPRNTVLIVNFTNLQTPEIKVTPSNPVKGACK